MHTFHLKSHSLQCPCCNRNLDAAHNPESFHQPQKGDFTICVYCGTILEYDGETEEELSHRIVSEEGLQKLKQEEPDLHAQLLKYKEMIDAFLAAHEEVRKTG